MILDRTQSPDFQRLTHVQLPAVQTTSLDNGLLLHLISVAQQPVLRLELIFDAGTWFETTPATSFFAVKMLAEGTATRTSAQISEQLDRVGAFLELNSGPDRASVVVYCLTKFLPDILPLLQELLTESVFPEKEFADLQNITGQNLKVNFEKTAHLAGVLAREALFGATHPYGRSQRPETIESVTRADVQTFFERVIRQRPFQILLAGKAGVHEIELLNNVFGQQTVGKIIEGPGHIIPTRTEQFALLHEKPDSLQSSIRVGRLLFTRHHPDFIKVLVMNEIFGGYFGSRLMKNIREEKGFTYGISSNIASFRRAGFLMIGTDVKAEFTQQTIDEIGKEIRILQTQPVPADELETVKNYMAGEFVGSLNTPFEIADRYKTILLDGLPADFLTGYIDRVRAVTAEDILAMATIYLAEKTLSQIIVGKK
jgi:zinc protease